MKKLLALVDFNLMFLIKSWCYSQAANIGHKKLSKLTYLLTSQENAFITKYFTLPAAYASWCVSE